MSGFENWPAPILRRWLLSAAAGPVIFLIGLAGRIALHDPTLLTLSTLLASCIVVRCILLFQAIRQGDYAAMGYADGQEFDMRRRLEPSA